MKKQASIAVIALSLALSMAALAKAQSVGDYQTNAHNLQFRIGERINAFNSYTIRIWNKPRDADDGLPDIIFSAGKTEEGIAGDGMCSREVYTFVQTHPVTTLEIFHPDSECQIEEHPENAVGELIVGDGTAKGRWWIYPR